jgi:hypothetical protein
MVPHYQRGGQKKPVYVESKNDPRYISYQDSLLAYTTLDKYKNIPKNIPFKKEDEKNIRKIWASNLEPLARDFSNPRPLTDRSNGNIERADYFAPTKYKKPQQQVIVQRPKLEALQNNLQPEGLIQSNTEFNADMSGLRPKVIQPKYYDVEENINQPFGGSQTNYRTSDLNSITSPDDLGAGNTRKITPHYQRGGRNKIAPSLERQLLSKYVDPVTDRAMARAKQQGIRTGIHNGGLDAIRHSSSAAATSSILPSWANALPGGLSANIAMTNLAGLAHEVNSPNSFKEHASDLYNNFVGSVVGTLPITEESKHDLLIEAQKNGILSDMGNKRPSNSRQTRPSNNKQNNMDNTTNSAFNRNIRGKKTFNQFLLGDTPEFRKGGQKSDWISDKISTLVREGYPQKQAVAIAYSMYDNVHGNGGYQLPMYQTAGRAITINTPTSELFGNSKFADSSSVISPEQFSKENKKITEINPYEYGVGVDPNKSESFFTASKDFKERTDEMFKTSGLPQNFDKNIFGEEGEKEKTAPLDVKGEQPFQFFNPYSGFDIPTAASTLGSSIESGDTFGTVASGLKLATGLARNFLGGMGQERRKNFVQKQQAEKQRESMTGVGREEMKKFGGYYQEGGMQPGMEEGMEQQGQEQQIMGEVVQMLQQGADPQQVIQQLVQMGIPEEHTS